MPLNSTRGAGSAKGFGFTGSVPFVATGGSITNYGAYTVHTFTTNGTFAVSKGKKACDILIVAGGAGGGGWHAGGGGAGGLIELPSNIIGTGNYSITIGGKGLGSQSGSDTTAFSQTAKGGGACTLLPTATGTP
jgi:hypothetical protein